MDNSKALSLLPLMLFLGLFLGTGFYLEAQDVEFAFYQLPAPVAALPAIILALALSKEKINDAIEQFMAGAGHSNVMAMCFIYLLAGAFTAIAQATGANEAALMVGLQFVPDSWLLPGIFIMSALIATAMGTSMGTIAAVAPIALGLSELTDGSSVMFAGAVLSGAMFGDNLSIISDTTIAATRTQGCSMKDKFRANLKIAVPAALIAITYFALQDIIATDVADKAVESPYLALSYVVILVLAILGLNVFVTLTLGILTAALLAMTTPDGYALGEFTTDIYSGFGAMQEIFLLSMFLGGISALMEKQGGLEWLVSKLSKGNDEHRGETQIAMLAALTNFFTANNTVAILVSGGVANEIRKTNHIDGPRSASLLDIFACIVQGLLPYGAQALLLGATFTLSPVDIVMNNIYGFNLLLVASLSLIIARRNAIKREQAIAEGSD